MNLSVWADSILALLLVATIAYSFVLNRRLGSVRSDRDKFEILIRSLNAASQRAETATANLRSTAEELQRRLERKVEEGRGLTDDLTYMIERGGTIADRLAGQIRAGRDGLKPDLRSEPRPAPQPAAEARVEHRVEPIIPPAQQAETPRPAPARAEPKRLDAAPVAAPPPEPEYGNIASRAERELLRALARRR